MQSTLRVRLERGEALPAADSNGKSDPYVVFKLDGAQKIKSQIVYKTLNPDFSEDFLFDEDIKNVGKVLSLEVYDKDTLSSDLLGTADVDVSNLAPGKHQVVAELTNASKPGPRGKIYLILERTKDDINTIDTLQRENTIKASTGMGFDTMFKSVTRGAAKAISKVGQVHPQGGKGEKRMITVEVIQARGVPPMDSNGTTDAYVIVKVGKKRRTTKTEFRTLKPDWRESFSFQLFDMGGRDSNICQVALWDRDSIGSDEKIGSLEIDLAGLPLNLTDERWWKLTRHESKSFFGFGGSKHPKDGEELPDVELLLLITVSNLFEPQIPPDQLMLAQKASQGWLRIHVIKAINLGSFDSNGFSDPFVVIEIGNRHMRTPTIKKNLNPEWDCVLETPVKDVFECAYVHVYDEDDNGKYEHMGSLCIPLLSAPYGIPLWYQLKNESLQKPAEGCIQLSFNLNYLKLPMYAKCISRRAPRYMVKPELFKFKILKANIARISVFAHAMSRGVTLLLHALTWQISPEVTVSFGIGWVTFWIFAQIWHLTIALCFGVLYFGFQKLRGKRSLMSVFDLDAYDEDEEDQEEAQAMEEEPDEEEADTGKKSSMNPVALRRQMRQLKALARSVQNVLGDIASYLERIVNLFTWASPVMTMICAFGLFMASLLLMYIPLRYFVLLWGVNKIVRTGLRKYNPAFKRPPYYVPIIELIEFLGRVPDNLEVEQRKPLPLPDNLQKENKGKPSHVA